MLPSRNRLQARKPLGTPRPTATALSSAPVLHKDKTSAPDLEHQPNTAVSSAISATPVAQSAVAPSSVDGYSTEQYTYVTDEHGYTWLYDTVSGQYYYYDAEQATYVAYGAPAVGVDANVQMPEGNEQKAAVEPEETRAVPKNRRIVRMAGGQVWEDPTLDDWPANDYRLFAGDLGPEVTSETLELAFGKFRSLQRTHVVREKKTGKSRGYGFLSFGDPDDFLKAWREFNGKYVGSRPIKLKKSGWKERNADIRKVKRTDKRAFLEFKHRKR
ncbi:hypothetical protein GGI07_005718 [Coemansia sp. Benny D115]|nr:hypothetical protein GGI07_005718 [Coemansia sp. Benny D115]